MATSSLIRPRKRHSLTLCLNLFVISAGVVQTCRNSAVARIVCLYHICRLGFVSAHRAIALTLLSSRSVRRFAVSVGNIAVYNHHFEFFAPCSAQSYRTGFYVIVACKITAVEDRTEFRCGVLICRDIAAVLFFGACAYGIDCAVIEIRNCVLPEDKVRMSFYPESL